MNPSLDAHAQDQLFRQARTFNKFTGEPVSDDTLHALYELAKWGPTSMNCQPMRVVFVRSPEAKARLRPALSAGNLDKTMAAPVTAIIASDSRFFEALPTQFPANPGAQALFESKPQLAADTEFRNSSLQGAYLILAARALGLAAGPMSGFDAQALDAAFFPDGRWKSNFLVNLGWGDEAGVRPRGPRLAFDEAVRIA